MAPSTTIAEIKPGHPHHDISAGHMREAGLNTSDLDRPDVRVFALTEAGTLIGAVGLERTGSAGLLRSLVVVPDRRGEGHARTLCAYLLGEAGKAGLDALYLLTNTAASLFETVGFEVADRADAPEAIAASQQFASLCPASAVFMRCSLEDD